MRIFPSVGVAQIGFRVTFLRKRSASVGKGEQDFTWTTACFSHNKLVGTLSRVASHSMDTTPKQPCRAICLEMSDLVCACGLLNSHQHGRAIYASLATLPTCGIESFLQELVCKGWDVVPSPWQKRDFEERRLTKTQTED